MSAHRKENIIITLAWRVYDRADRAWWAAWGIVPAVRRYRDLAVRVDKQGEVISLLSRLVETLASVVDERGIAELERRKLVLVKGSQE